MSNSREIMERRILLANGNYQIFEALRELIDNFVIDGDDDTTVYKLINLHNDVPICKADYLSIRERTYTPNHRNNGRSKFKRPGR